MVIAAQQQERDVRGHAAQPARRRARPQRILHRAGADVFTSNAQVARFATSIVAGVPAG
jgi:hypothetical protein